MSAHGGDSNRQAMVVLALFAAVVGLAGVVAVAAPTGPISAAPSAADIEALRDTGPALTPEEAARAEAIAEAARTPPRDLLDGAVSEMLGKQLEGAPPLPPSMRSHEVDAAASSYDDLMGYDGKVFKQSAGKPLLVEGRKTPKSLPKPKRRKLNRPRAAKKSSPSPPPAPAPTRDPAVAEVAPAPAPAAPAEKAAAPVPGEPVRETLTRAKRSLNRGDPRGAVQAYRQALAANPGNLRARYGLAKARYAMNDVSRARDELSRVLKASPQHSGALLMMASVLRETGDRGGAKTQYQRYLSAHPEGRHADKVKRMLASL